MGYIISGGIVSNIEVLWIARNKCRAMNKNSQYVLAPEDCHYSIQKACDIVGLKMKPLKIDINIPPNQIPAVGCPLWNHWNRKKWGYYFLVKIL